jgi:hypothetical protein
MLKLKYWLNLSIALQLIFLFGCTEHGSVDQGRVVAYDKDKRIMVMIRDKKMDPQNPDYTYLPPLTYVLPTDPLDTGPEPKAGGRMKLDAEKNQVVIFDQAAQNLKAIDVKFTEKKENVDRLNPLVYDESKKAAKKFPVVDKEKKTVTLYSGRQNLFVTFIVPDEFIDLPEATWDSGDEVRVYFKEAGKALRFMNISKTDIFRG